MFGRLKRWMDHPDRDLKKANTLAVMLAGNQILYAPSLAIFIGRPGFLAWPVVVSAPAFAATLWLARRHPPAARVWLPLVGMFDTVLAQLTMGRDSGAWIFYLPSITLAAFLVRRHERWMVALLTLVAFAAFLLLPAGHEVFDAETAATVARINASSALILTGFIGWMFREDKA